MEGLKPPGDEDLPGDELTARTVCMCVLCPVTVCLHQFSLLMEGYLQRPGTEPVLVAVKTLYCSWMFGLHNLSHFRSVCPM